MQVINGRVILSTQPCHCADDPKTAGTMAGTKRCPTCKGTGRGVKGGARGCKACYGNGTTHDFEHPVTCGACEGTAMVAETYCDKIGAEDFYAIPMTVVRQDRDQSWNEQHLAHGYVWTCTDYGAAWGRTDEQLLEKIRSDARPYVQACKVCDDAGKVCDLIQVLLTPNGYSLRAAFEVNA